MPQLPKETKHDCQHRHPRREGRQGPRRVRGRRTGRRDRPRRGGAARAERLAQYDRALVEEYDDNDMLEQVRQAERDLVEAVADSALGRAWPALKLAELRRAHLSRHAADAAQRIGASIGYSTPVANNAAFEELGRAVDRAAAHTIGDELDTLDAAREQAGQG